MNMFLTLVAGWLATRRVNNMTISYNSIRFTKITSTTPNTLSKLCQLDEAGKLISSTQANMSDGYAEIATVDTLAQFAELLTRLQHNEALCYGLPPSPKIRVLSK